MPYLPYVNINGKVKLSSGIHQYYKDRFEVLNSDVVNRKTVSTSNVFYFKDLAADFGIKTNAKVNNSGHDYSDDGKRYLSASGYHGVGWYWTSGWGIQLYYYAGTKGISEKKGFFGWHKKKTGTWNGYNDYYISLSNDITITSIGNVSSSNQQHTWQRTLYNSRYWGYGINVSITSTWTGTTKGRISTAWCSVPNLTLN